MHLKSQNRESKETQDWVKKGREGVRGQHVECVFSWASLTTHTQRETDTQTQRHRETDTEMPEVPAM